MPPAVEAHCSKSTVPRLTSLSRRRRLRHTPAPSQTVPVCLLCPTSARLSWGLSPPSPLYGRCGPGGCHGCGSAAPPYYVTCSTQIEIDRSYLPGLPVTRAGPKAGRCLESAHSKTLQLPTKTRRKLKFQFFSGCSIMNKTGGSDGTAGVITVALTQQVMPRDEFCIQPSS